MQGISVQVIVCLNVSGNGRGEIRVRETNATLRAAGGFSISHCFGWGGVIECVVLGLAYCWSNSFCSCVEYGRRNGWRSDGSLVVNISWEESRRCKSVNSRAD